ncbi:hypothetical protein OHA79_49485 (plasmid) [Streptomyces sp. NBC_00841]|uniref:hypothetical protein n=1 Tax=unclassified Streptomyces TaxID=2593676 RepID=UPI00224CA457|nr:MULTISPECIES: hypothetical protein [unclassified Streptomyces]MCX4538661.1 hypothetical protein [Streptomyces sp. NBC_01669]WSA05525.1 hypothetical protein OHA79_49485 [Streptomyces sp. NBC_00841]
MIEPQPDSARRRDVPRRAFLAVGTAASAGVALGLRGTSPAAAAAATGTTHYVSKSGSDSAARTSATPLLTINAAAKKARPGDVVLGGSSEYQARRENAPGRRVDGGLILPCHGAQVTYGGGGVIERALDGYGIGPSARTTLSADTDTGIAGAESDA